MIDTHFARIDPSFFVNYSQQPKETSCEIWHENRCIHNDHVVLKILWHQEISYKHAKLNTSLTSQKSQQISRTLNPQIVEIENYLIGSYYRANIRDTFNHSMEEEMTRLQWLMPQTILKRKREKKRDLQVIQLLLAHTW